MRYGVNLDMSRPLPQIIDRAQELADAGFDSVNCSQIFGYDALTLLAVVGSHVPNIRLGTAVVPIYPRHPIVLAAQALTVQAATGGRLVLGIGLSHQLVIEHMFGYSFDKPARHMEEYLSALMPLLRDKSVAFDGETVKAAVTLEFDGSAPDVLVAALGPKMLELAGRLTQGTATWMTGPLTLESYIIPTINAAALEAGRPKPIIAAGLPICVTDDPDGTRAKIEATYATYGLLPSYRAMLDREGAVGPAGAAIVGDEDSVADQIRHLDQIGVTDLGVALTGSADEITRTMTLLRHLVVSRTPE